jgi:hypothetical protein
MDHGGRALAHSDDPDLAQRAEREELCRRTLRITAGRAELV